MSESKSSQSQTESFFTDRYSGQINTIKAIFGITPSICFWNMKRAVKKKIAKMIQEERVRIPKQDVAKLIQLLHKQYCIHPYLDGNRTGEQVRVRCVQEIEDQLSQGDYGTLRDYLISNWFSETELTIGEEKILFMEYLSRSQL